MDLILVDLILDGDRRQTGGGDGLPVPFFLLARNMKTYPFGDFRELGLENLVGGGKDQVAAIARHHAAQHQKVAEVIHVRVGCDVVAEVDADGFVNPESPRVAGGGQFLNVFKFHGKRHVGRQFDAGGPEQTADGLLGEVLCADAAIAGPFVHGRVLAIIHGDEGQFIEPGGDGALRRDESGGQAAAHGDAEDPVVIERHGTGQSGDFAIVHHVEGDAAPGCLQVEKETADASVEQVLGHGAVERTNADLIGHVDARCAAADGVDAGKFGGGALQRIVHTIEVILRIRLHSRVPADLFAEDHFAIHDGGALAIAGAQIEADTAAIQVAAEGRGGFLFHGGGVEGGGFNDHGAAVDALTHELVVEGAGPEIGRAHVELQSHSDIVCRLLLEKKKQKRLYSNTQKKKKKKNKKKTKKTKYT